MIVRKSGQGNISVAFGEECGAVITGAGIVYDAQKFGVRPCADYRIITGNGFCLTVCEREIFLSDGMAVVIAPGISVMYKAAENPMAYADFKTSEKLFSDPFKTVYYGDAARFGALIDGINGRSGCLQLYAEVLRIAALCADNACERPSCSDAKRYFDKYFYMPLNVAEQAEIFGYSREYFTAKFTREVGCSPYKYLTQVRIKNAEKLLRETDYPVRTVAAMCGYENVERFDEMFRKLTGLSPLKYRNKFALGAEVN